MLFTQGTIKTFDSIMGSIFYDWGYSQKPYLHKEEDNYFSINKTSIFQEEGVYYFSYKEEAFEVEPKVFAKLDLFYQSYKDNEEFQTVLDYICDQWFNHKLEKTDEGFKIGNVSISYQGNLFLVKQNDSFEISEKTFKAVEKFYRLFG